MSAWEVGQDVIVRHRNYGRGPTRVTEEKVSRVGRKYFFVQLAHEEVAFEIETGIERINGTNYSARAFTPESHQAYLERAEASDRLAGLVRDFGWRNRLTTEQMNAISDVIEASR